MSLTSLILQTVLPASMMLAHGGVRLRLSPLREPMWAGFLGGVVVAVIAAFWTQILTVGFDQIAMGPTATLLTHAILARALPEEGLKLGLLMVLVDRVIRLGAVRDTILAGMGIALGYGAMEAVTMFAGFRIGGIAQTDVAVPLRLLTTMFAEGVCGLAMGVLVGRVNDIHEIRSIKLVPALVVATAIHAGYESLLILNDQGQMGLWPAVALPVYLVGVLIVDLMLLGPLVRRWHRHPEEPRRPHASSAISLGVVALVGGLVSPIAALGQTDPLIQQVMALMYLLPAIYGLDLLLTAIAIFWARRMTIAGGDGDKMAVRDRAAW